MTAVKIMKRLCASNKIEECSISSAFQSVNEEEEDVIESNTTKEIDLSTSLTDWKAEEILHSSILLLAQSLFMILTAVTPLVTLRTT